MHIEKLPITPLEADRIDALGHIICVGSAPEGHEDFSDKIEVFRTAIEGDRAQIYQMWAIDRFASNPDAYDALQAFGLAGEGHDKKKWTQLLEHISGVTAIADHLELMMEKYGAQSIDRHVIEAASLLDNIEKPMAVSAGIEARDKAPLRTATLVHDIEKPAELAEGAGGFENSRDNPVLREGKLWRFLHEKGTSDDVILAAQNTGRSDRFFSELDDYEGDAVKQALIDREALAALIGVDRDVVDAMSPTERRKASIASKGRLPALVAIADAMAAQFKFQGLAEEAIDAMSAHYLTYKVDPESVAFFGQDWPAYYKQVRLYLIEQVPVNNRDVFIAELDTLTHNRIFNDTVLPEVIGNTAMQRSGELALSGEPNVYETLRYPESRMELVGVWTEAKSHSPNLNEDVTVTGPNVLALADGDTDQTGIIYSSGRSGGRELAEIATKVAASSTAYGYKLAAEITAAVRAFYEVENPDALNEPSKRAATTLVAARLLGDKLILTQVGDSNVRITFRDGTRKLFKNDKLIDIENAQLRSDHIQAGLQEKTKLVERDLTTNEVQEIAELGREQIQGRLNMQYLLRNNPEDITYGYGKIDGTTIPEYFADGRPTEYVKTYVLEQRDIATIELVSDGFYGEFPENISTADYEALHRRQHAQDPHKYLEHLSTKPKDDATVLIAQVV